MRAMPGGSPRLLSRLLLARARLPGPYCGAWSSMCLRYMTGAPDKLSVSSWANALWALVRMRHAPSRYANSSLHLHTSTDRCTPSR